MNENIDIPEKITVPVLIAFLHFFDIVLSKFGRGVGNKVQCKMNDHEWKDVPDHKFLKYCARGCGATDDIRTEGIDGLNEKDRKRIARKLIRESRKVEIRKNIKARFQRWKNKRDR